MFVVYDGKDDGAVERTAGHLYDCARRHIMRTRRDAIETQLLDNPKKVLVGIAKGDGKGKAKGEPDPKLKGCSHCGNWKNYGTCRF